MVFNLKLCTYTEKNSPTRAVIFGVNVLVETVMQLRRLWYSMNKKATKENKVTVKINIKFCCVKPIKQAITSLHSWIPLLIHYNMCTVLYYCTTFSHKTNSETIIITECTEQSCMETFRLRQYMFDPHIHKLLLICVWHTASDHI